MKAISEDYNYDENYLKKMKEDMLFLKECQGLQKYFIMNNGEIDAFLTNFAPRTNSNESYSKINSNKAKIPVSEELNKFINQCRYILIQESFFDNMRDGGSQLDFNFKKGESNDMNDYNVNNNSFILNKSNISKNNKSNVSFRLKSSSPHNSKIQFFKDNENANNVENKEISKFFMNEKQDNSVMGRNLEYLRKKMGKEYNNLFLSNQDKNQVLKSKNYNPNIVSYNDMYKENLFRKPSIGNQIMIEREEKREKTKSDFKLQNNFLRQKENPLSQVNEELNKELNEVCFENETLKKEIDDLKKHVKTLKEKYEKQLEEKETKEFKKDREIDNLIKKYELKIKDLENQIENLIKEKEGLIQEIEKIRKLMEEREEENKKKIEEINNSWQKEKSDLEKVIEEKDNKIKDLTDLRDDLIREKNEIIRQKEQIISERDQLIDDKNNLEEKVNNLENDYKNLNLKENDMEKKIKELNGVIEDKEQEKKKIINEMNDKIGELNNEISEWQFKLKNSEDLINSMKNEIAMMIKEKDALVNDKNNLEQRINIISNENTNLKGEYQNLTQKKNDLERQINNLNQEKNKLNNDINDLNNKINNLTQENIKLKNEIEELKLNQNNIIKDDNNSKEVEVPDKPSDTCLIKGDYKYDFYRENLFNLTQALERSLPLDEIPDFIKSSFDLNNINIYDDLTYIKGVYPKIIIATLKDSEVITGVCSVYYENYGQMDEPLILRIGALCVTENNWDEQIETIINYIKDKIDFDELKIVINYMPSPEHQNKLRLNDKIKEVFNGKLKCIWKNLTNLPDGSRTQDVRFTKQGEYFNQDENTNLSHINKELFEFNTLSILSLFDNDNLSDFKQKFSSIGFNEYINLFPIYVLLANNPTYTMFFANENDKNAYELPEEDDPEKNNGVENPKNQIRKISKMSTNLDDISKLKEIISSLDISRIFDIDDSLCQEINNKLQSQINSFSFNYFSMNLNLSTTTNYCLEYEDYYYNRISSKNIDIFRDPETKNYFYLVPTRTESTFILLCQLSTSLKQDLLDGHKNLYQAFMEYHPRLTSQLLKFSSIGLAIQQIKQEEKVIYIPSFKIDTHLFSESINDINKMGNLTNNKTGSSGCVGSIDEYFRMCFEVDKNINNGFTIVPADDGKIEVIIKDSFLFAVFNTNIISSTPLQLFYVTKDHWIKSK